jgi:pSer/pThr/pTyr-binding forkhead associated (FHA) protein
MTAKLVVVRGAKPATIRLKRLPATMGRGSQASLKVGDTLVSRKHCEIYEEDGRLMVRDLDSANGTFVNKLRIDQPTQLASGDLLKVGPVVLKAVCQEPPPPAEDSFIDLAEVAEEDVAVPASDAASQSRVEYKETPDGSFIGISDDDEIEAFAEPAGFAEEPVAEEPVAEEPVAEEPHAQRDDVAFQEETPAQVGAEPADVDVATEATDAVSLDESVETEEAEPEPVDDLDEATDLVEKEPRDEQEDKPAEIGPPADTERQTAEQEKEKEAAADVLAGLDVEETPPEDVSTEDSALNDFFKNL